jgi:hypothetical protein
MQGYIHQPMLKLKTHSGFLDLFLKHTELRKSVKYFWKSNDLKAIKSFAW